MNYIQEIIDLDYFSSEVDWYTLKMKIVKG